MFLDVNQNDFIDPGEPSAISDGAGQYTVDTTGVSGQWHLAALDLQVGAGGRWLDIAANHLYVDALNGQSGANLGVYFEPYSAVEPDGVESAINSTTAGVQDYSTVAADAAGNYVVVWRSAAGGNQSILARLFDAGGSPSTGEITVASGTDLALPFVDMADNGRFAVTWSSGSDLTNAFARVYAANGTPATNVLTVAAVQPNTRYQAHGVAMDADGDFAVLYSSTKPRMTIKVQRYTAAGAINGKAIQVAQPSLINGRNNIGMDDAGNFVVVWEDPRILAQRFGSNGKPTGSQILIGAEPSGVYHTRAVMNSSGQWAVSWHAPGGVTNPDRVRLMNANGTPAGPLIVNLTSAPEGLAIDDAGTVTMSWGSFGEVRFRRLIGGTTLEPEFVVNTTTAGSQSNATYHYYFPYSNSGLAATGNDRFVVAWHGNGPGDDAGIFAQRFALPVAPRPGFVAFDYFDVPADRDPWE